MNDLQQNTEDRWDGLREVTQMAWPIMLGALSFVIMDFVDKVFVAWLDRDLANPYHLAAIGSASVWSYTLGVFFVGVAGCVSTFSAQSLGRGNRENCSAFAWQGIYISLAAGAIALLMFPLSRPLFGSMGHGPTVTELELTYFRIRILSFVFVAWQGALAAFFQAINRPIIPMYTTIAGNVTNIVLDYLLVFGKLGLPAMGIAGAATATVIAMMVQAALLQAIFMSAPVHREYATRGTWRFDAVKARDLFRIGWPSGLSSFLDVASWSVFTSFIVGGFGALQLAAHTAAINFMHLTFIPAMGIGMAVTPIVGQWLGRADFKRAKRRAYTATKLAIAIMVSIGTTLAVFGGSLMRVFSEDPSVIHLGHLLLIFAAIFAGFDAVNIVMIGALRGTGDTRWMMGALAVGSYGLCLPLAWFFSGPLGLQAKGAWFGAMIYIIVLSGAFLRRFHSEAWRSITIFSEDRPLEQPAATPEAVAAELESSEQSAV